MESLRSGLIIAEPYISQILCGDKTWEMRGKHTTKRERVGLIRKGSGTVVGSALLVNSIGPVTHDELLKSTRLHGIPKEQVRAGLLDKWNVAWVLEDIIMFDAPVKYEHPNGAVTWVNLYGNFNSNSEVIPKPISKAKLKQVVQHHSESIVAKPQTLSEPRPKPRHLPGTVPYAKDGTCFGQHLLRNGQYSVGAKGDEHKFTEYEAALAYLMSMKTAKWRRPNPKGNWGIVSAIEWR